MIDININVATSQNLAGVATLQSGSTGLHTAALGKLLLHLRPSLDSLHRDKILGIISTTLPPPPPPLPTSE